MKATNSVTLSRVANSNSSLNEIKKLWRDYADTLGFFPEGAFEHYAQKGQIIIAVDSSSTLLGYLLYRVTPSRNDASIVHLCVNKDARGQGIASLLVKELLATTKPLKGIGLKCRRDFEANKIWPKFGFKAMSESVGKSKAGSTLTRWWYDHNHPDLFSIAQNTLSDETKRVVIDANIFYDLKNKCNDESLALTADWLDDSISIYLTDEIFNEINRASSETERNSSRAFATNFDLIRCEHEAFESTYCLLKQHIPAKPSEQDISDFTHLAKAISAKVDFYVTRDEKVLNKSNAIYELFGIPIIRPSDLVIEIDSLYRESEYQPARLAGTLCKVSRVQSKAESRIVDIFQNEIEGERQTNLKACLRNILSNPRDIDCFEALDHNNNSIGLVSYNKQISGILKVELLRTNKKHVLSKTLIRHLIGKIIKEAEDCSCYLINISDPYLDSDTKAALQEDNFHKTDDGWLKLSIFDHYDPRTLSKKLSHIGNQHENLNNYCQTICTIIESAATYQDLISFKNVEALISPGLIKASSIPCYIVPIRPFWAQHLFDEYLASNDLFGARLDLALNREAVYYRSPRNSAGISLPARILWYVSHNKKFPGSGALRAYSRVDEVVVDYPKQLFRQFRRLGIYEWKDVLYTAKSIDKQLMAIKFSNTSLLKCRCDWKSIQKALSDAGINSQLQSPCRIPEELFFSLIK
ncbi:GNAT family N-acetyltransferase [Methylophilus sp. YYY-1]|uniref:GNAT family N-acetyltransferase n=1 Tax=Methylophilus sp. YYY-1 TaxID=2682087 RepID=UPI0023B2A146|nr:GNAT family N-acetyltransferase [Methylophilus sp. YYY-1]MDF0378130.1 GNAT family N-acetyltransferase [Methylophilus sp. YYY-1]